MPVVVLRRPVKRLAYEGPSTYSSLAAGPHRTIYLLFERGTNKLHETITLARFNLPWLHPQPRL